MFFPAHLLVSGRRVLLRHIVRLICVTVIALKSVDLAAALPPPTQPVPEATLLALAQKKFGTLSRVEEEVFRAAQEGRPAYALTGGDEIYDTANAANWPADRAVRAKCISWVCTDPQASALVTYRGLDLHGMRIDGELDLSDAEIKFQLMASKCAFSGDISLLDARLRGLYLLDSRIKRFNANRAKINSSLLLRGKSFKAEGEVILAGAKISGDLDCTGAQFSYVLVSLNGNGVKIEGNVVLRDGFKAEGEVNLSAATIGGVLDCGGGQFSNEGGVALTVNSAKIKGVFLHKGFEAVGEVDLVAASIGDLQIRDVTGAHQMILDLRHTQAGIFWDDEGSWPKAGNLFLGGFRYERFEERAPFEADRRKKWLNLQPRDKFRPQPYEQLAGVLRQVGHERDARQVMIEKNRERARFTHFPHQGWWWYNLFGRFIGYGYEPWRAFAASLAMILLGTLLFRLGSKHDLIGPTSDNAYVRAPDGQVIEENGRPQISEKYPVFNAFVYSLESFVPLLRLDQNANWRPNANRSTEISIFHRRVPYSGRFLRGYLYFHIAAGWLFTSLWVGAITGLVKT